MKIQINTENKTIKIEERVLLSSLLAFISIALPHDWKDYTLETTNITNWSSPIIVQPLTPLFPYEPRFPQIDPYYPTYDIPKITCGITNYEIKKY